jgi:hypothetical protein
MEHPADDDTGREGISVGNVHSGMTMPTIYQKQNYQIRVNPRRLLPGQILREVNRRWYYLHYHAFCGHFRELWVSLALLRR